MKRQLNVNGIRRNEKKNIMKQVIKIVLKLLIRIFVFLFIFVVDVVIIYTKRHEKKTTNACISFIDAVEISFRLCTHNGITTHELNPVYLVIIIFQNLRRFAFRFQWFWWSVWTEQEKERRVKIKWILFGTRTRI